MYRKINVNITEEDFKKFLCDEKLTNKQLSSIFNCSSVTISRWRKKYKIKISSGLKKGQHNNKIVRYEKCCKMCNKLFYTTPKENKKYCSRNCMYSDIDYLNLLKNVDKSYMNTEKYKKAKQKETTPEYTRYKNLVHRLTRKIYNQNKDIINPNNYKRTLCGIDGGYQLDHIKSIRKCFDEGISPENASHISNLQIIPWKTNLLKR